MANLAKIPQAPQDAPPPIWAPGAMDGAPPDLGLAPAPMVSRIPTMGEQNIAHDEAKLQKVQWNQEHPWGTPENHPGKLGKVAHAFSTLGNIAGNIVAPNVMANVPGTQMNMQQQEGTLAKRVNQEQSDESQNQYRGAEQAKTEEATREAPAKAASEEELQGAQTENLQNPTLQHMETDQGIFAFNPKTKELTPLTYQGQPLKGKQPDAGKLSYQTAIDPATGKPHVYGLDAQGNKKADIGEHYERPITVNAGGGAHEFAELERGRGLLDKAEGSYRTAQQGANGLRAMVDNASHGDKMSARMLPLEGALEITTSQGVHRINRTEVDQYAGGGSAFDRLAGALRGGGTGIPFTNEILGSMKHLADIQEKGAYENYKGAYDSASKRYHLSDEKPLNAPGGGTAGAPQGADNEVYVKGQLVGHTVQGKYVPLAK